MLEKKVSEEIEMQDMVETYKTIIEALERHIPQKTTGHCPKCFRAVNLHSSFCSNCGQALDWRALK